MARYRSYSAKSSYKPRSLRRREQKTKNILVRNIILGLVVLYVVFAWGIPALVGGLSVFNKFKKVDQNTPVTQDETIAPPVLNIPYEATNTATIRISGYASPKDKVKIYLDDDLKTTAPVDDNGSFTSDPISLALGTNNIYGKTQDDNNHESLPSKNIRLLYSSDKPKLEISSPDDNSQIKGGDKKVTVSGVTDPNNNITVNDTVAVVDSSGNFSTAISINDGDNNIVVTATNSFGNSTQVSRKVTYSAS